MNTIRKIALLACFIGSSALQVYADSTAEVNVITMGHGGAISGAWVRVAFAQTGVETCPEARGITASNGVFAATNTTSGRVLIMSKANGYQDGFAHIELWGSGPWNTNVIVRMEQLRMGTVTVQVTGLDGQPVSNALVQIGFEQSDDSRIQGVRAEGVTDSDGRFAAAQRSTGSVGGLVSKAGYYATICSAQIVGASVVIPVVLKERKNPIPMYAKDVDITMPSTNAWHGFDLAMGDWVVPNGRGVTNDFLLKVVGSQTSRLEYNCFLYLAFSNQMDGVVPITVDEGCGSKLRSNNEAPTNGYENARTWHTERHGRTVVDDRHDGMMYYFRVRTVTNEQGVIVNALYGKIYGDIGFLRFVSYLNPDGTRNVEFDPNRNLIPTPGGLGQVSAP